MPELPEEIKAIAEFLKNNYTIKACETHLISPSEYKRGIGRCIECGEIVKLVNRA